MKIRLVVFDVAGTTVRDDDAVHNCLREALAADSVYVTRDQVNEVMGLPKPLAIRKLLEAKRNGHPIAEKRIDSIHNDFQRRMVSHYRGSSRVEPMPHALDALTLLRQAGVRVALDTGFNRPILDTVLERLGWNNSDLLDATVTSDEVPRGRPHPDLLLKAMRLTGITEAPAVAKVGDTPSDLYEGTAAGAGLVIGVTNGSHTAEELRPHPHTCLIPDLSELPNVVFQHI